MQLGAMWQILVGVALLAPIGAQLAILPVCADTCEDLAAAGADGCSFTDPSCYCEAPADEEILNCVRGACSNAEFLEFIQWGEKQCSAIGITFNPGASSTPNAAMPTSFVTVTSSNPNGGQANTVAANGGSESPAATHAASSSSGGVNIGVIVGPVVGGVVLIVAVAGFFVWRARRKANYAITMAANAMATSPYANESASTNQAASATGGTEVHSVVVDSAPVGSEKRPSVPQALEVESDEDEVPNRI